MRITELDATDIEGAAAIYRERVLANDWRDEDARTMYMVIADSDALSARLQRVREEPAVAAALASRPAEPE